MTTVMGKYSNTSYIYVKLIDIDKKCFVFIDTSNQCIVLNYKSVVKVKVQLCYWMISSPLTNCQQ